MKPFVSLERRIHEAKNFLPPENFRESLKAFLFAQIGEKNEQWFAEQQKLLESNEAFGVQKERIWARVHSSISIGTKPSPMAFFHSSLFWMICGGIVVLVLGMIFFLRFLLGTGSPAVFENQLTFVSGQLLVNQSARDQYPATLRLEPDDVITTQGDRATITFFDDTFVVLGEDTTIRIEQIGTHPSFPDTGEIEIELEQGNIWIRNFDDPTRDTRVVVRSGDISFVPFSAALDVTRFDDGEVVARIWEKSVRVRNRGEQKSEILLAGEKIIFSPEVPQIITSITGADRGRGDVRRMRDYDREYRAERVEQILEEYRDRVGVLPNSRWYPLKLWTQEHLFPPQTLQEHLAMLTERFEETAVLIDTDDQKDAISNLLNEFQDLLPIIQDFSEFEPWTQHSFRRLRKDFSALETNSPLEKMYTLILSSETEAFLNDEMYIQRNLVETLWSIQKTIFENSQMVSKGVFDSYIAQKELLPNIITQRPEEKQQLLRLKIQELELLNVLFFSIFADEDIEQIEEKILLETIAVITNTREIDAEFLRDEDFTVEREQIDFFRERIYSYTTSQARKNQAERMVSRMKPEMQKLLLLHELKKRFGDELRDIFTQKIVEIIEQELQNAILEEN